MKSVLKLFWIFLLIFVIVVLIFWKKTPSVSPTGPASESAPARIPSSTERTIEWNGRAYAYVYFLVDPEQEIELIPNFSQKLTSGDIAEKHSCIRGINGGFYDTDNAPLGGFMTNESVVKKPVSNRLIDGFLWSTGTDRAITLSKPPDDAEWYLQSGPLLMVNGGITTISISDDQYRRRSLAGIARGNKIIFLMLFHPESVYEGPLLAELPALISALNKKESLNLTDAINLDGGSASSFVSKDRTLQEFSPVGSFFCVK